MTEGRKKEASKVKQTTRHPRQLLFLRKMNCLRWDSNPRHSTHVIHVHVYMYTSIIFIHYIHYIHCIYVHRHVYMHILYTLHLSWWGLTSRGISLSSFHEASDPFCLWTQHIHVQCTCTCGHVIMYIYSVYMSCLE